MHVLMANGTLQGGGAERMIAILSRQLRAMGHRVSIAALSAGGEVLDELRAEGFETADGVSRNRAAGIWSTAARLKRFVRDRGVDVVHTHDLRSLIEVGVCRRLTGAFRHVHTFHFGNYPHLPRKHLALEHVFSRTPDRLVAVGHAQCESVTRALRLPRRRVRVIWNGVDRPGEDKADRSEERAARRTAPVVASVSAFFPQKGLPVLLEAARIVRARGVGFRLVLVGNGPLRGELEALVTRLGLSDTVEFAGWRQDAARSVLPALDVFVQSSHWEAMSIVLLEAMAAGCPIVATAVGENPLVLKQGETGILVPPGDPEALAQGLTRLLQNEPLRRRLADAARESYEASFTATAMAQRYDATYKELLRRNRPNG